MSVEEVCVSVETEENKSVEEMSRSVEGVRRSVEGVRRSPQVRRLKGTGRTEEMWSGSCQESCAEGKVSI